MYNGRLLDGPFNSTVPAQAYAHSTEHACAVSELQKRIRKKDRYMFADASDSKVSNSLQKTLVRSLQQLAIV